MEIPSVPSSLGHSFMHDFQRFNCYLVGGGVETGTTPLRRPSVDEVPANLFLTRFVHQHDRSILAFGFAVDGLLSPVPKRLIVGDAALQRDVGVLRLTRQF